jgi:hypothetical protein
MNVMTTHFRQAEKHSKTVVGHIYFKIYDLVTGVVVKLYGKNNRL